MDDETEQQHLLLAERHILDAIRRIRKQHVLLANLGGAQRQVGTELLAVLYGSLQASPAHRRLIRHAQLAGLRKGARAARLLLPLKR
jgi:hypothetical protein